MTKSATETPDTISWVKITTKSSQGNKISVWIVYQHETYANYNGVIMDNAILRKV